MSGLANSSTGADISEMARKSPRRLRYGVAQALSVLLLAPLVGCVSPQEIRQQDEMHCSGYGFQPGTDAFKYCLQNESLARRFRPSAYGGRWWR